MYLEWRPCEWTHVSCWKWSRALHLNKHPVTKDGDTEWRKQRPLRHGKPGLVKELLRNGTSVLTLNAIISQLYSTNLKKNCLFITKLASKASFYLYAWLDWIEFVPIWFDFMRHVATRHDSTRRHDATHGTTRDDATRRDTMRHNTTWHDTTQHDTTRLNTMPLNFMLFQFFPNKPTFHWEFHAELETN